MSFADAVREELCDLPIKSACCQRALTEGLLLCARADGKVLSVRYKQEVVATLASAMIRRCYGKVPESEMRGACGHRYYDFSFFSPACYKKYTTLRGSEARVCDVLQPMCEGCRSAFLRGVFLACGTLNDPHRSFHLEFLLSGEREAALFEDFLTMLGYPPRRIRRASGIGLYFKDSGSVEDLVALMGAQHTIFEIINSRIERDIRNDENRATNCVAKNIERSISAATVQMEAIGLLMEHGKLERMPDGMRESAMLRYQNPDATLDELAAMHTPPISKSGLNHRLSKLLAAAEELKRT